MAQPKGRGQGSSGRGRSPHRRRSRTRRRGTSALTPLVVPAGTSAKNVGSLLHERTFVFSTSSPAFVVVANTQTDTKPGALSELRLEGIWRVVVLNDPVNLMSYVVMVFKKV